MSLLPEPLAVTLTDRYRLTHGDTTPVPLVASPFTELHPAVSPDGRWLACTSIESGTNEVYVRPFPATNGGRWQVSNGAARRRAGRPTAGSSSISMPVHD